MATQTKKAPGRPKKVQPEPEKLQQFEGTPIQNSVPDTPLKKKFIKRKEKVNQNKEYEVVRGGGVAFMLPQKGVTVYDEAKNTVREIRYCPNEPSVWSDEQGDRATRQSVIFREGRLFAPKDKPNLREFLDLHPGNVANGGKTFREVNKKKDAEKELKREFLQNDAIAMVRDRDVQDLLPIALFFNIDINTSVSDIRYNLLQIAKKKPAEFIESFDSPQVAVRSAIVQAKDYQIINMKDDGVYWFDTNSLIVSVPVGQDPMDVMVRFCLTERGSSVVFDLERRLVSLS